MKKILFLTTSLLFAFFVNAQVSKTVNVEIAGTLRTLLTTAEMTTVTNLTLTGSIDARDIKIMRDSMPLLAILDIEKVSIKSFTGIATSPYQDFITTYPSNEMPAYSFTTISNNGNPINNTTIKSITLPNNISSIGNYAFRGCSGLTGSLILPPSLRKIGDYSFSGCSGLTGRLNLPDLLTSIGREAFSGCNGFTDSLLLPNSITSIGGYAFSYCYRLSSLTINSDIWIGEKAFYRCSGLTSLTIGDSVTSIGNNVFENCSSLKIINCLNPTPPKIGSYAFAGVTPSIVFVPETALTAYKTASDWRGFTIATEKRVTINNPTAGGFAATLITAGYGPLSSITHLTVTGILNSLDIGQINTSMTALTEMDLSGIIIAEKTLPTKAFQNKTILTSIILPPSLVIIGDYSFSGCTGLFGDLMLPDSVTSIGNYAFSGCNSLSGNLIIPNSVISIGTNAFQSCTGFNGALSIGNNVNSIGNSAFYGCSGFTGSLTIPNSVTSIEPYAFKSCTGFNGALSIGNNVNSIGFFAFYGCSGFTGNLTIPNSVTSIEPYAFKSCTGFNGALSIGNSVNSIGNSAFNGCSGFTGNLTIPNSVTSIGLEAFQNCTGFNGTLSIGNSVNSIGNSAFDGCSGFTGSLTIPNSVTSIGTNAFQSCNGLSGTLTLPNGITSISASAFSGCTGFSGILSIPLSVTSIGASAFSGCNQLTELTISKNTTTINDNAFLNCTGLTKISVPRTLPPIIYANTFGGVPKETCWLVVPTGSTVTYQTTNYWSSFIFFTEKDFISAVFSTKDNQINVYTTQSDIFIEGTYEGETVALYTINGVHLETVKSQGERMVIPVQRDAVYLVKTKSKTFKVIL